MMIDEQLATDTIRRILHEFIQTFYVRQEAMRWAEPTGPLTDEALEGFMSAKGI